jgi:hypothetical protein
MSIDWPADASGTPDWDDSDTVPATADVASYVADMVKGLREVTGGAGARRDLGFLDYLLAMAEDEATKLCSNVYH